MAAARRAVDLDPLVPFQHLQLGQALLYAGADPNEVIETLERGIAMSRAAGHNLHFFLYFLGIAYAEVGRESDSLRVMVEQFPDHESTLEQGHATDGLKGMILGLAEATGEDYREGCNVAFLGLAGATERMYACFERVFELGDLRWLPQLLHASVEFAAYRDEPRFQALINRIDERIRLAAGTMAPSIPARVLEQPASEP